MEIAQLIDMIQCKIHLMNIPQFQMPLSHDEKHIVNHHESGKYSIQNMLLHVSPYHSSYVMEYQFKQSKEDSVYLSDRVFYVLK